MSGPDICPFTAADLCGAASAGGALLALNNANARALSWLDPERLAALAGQAFLALRIVNGDGFLLAFDQDADYDSPNFLWFRGRYERFVYIDRVVVATPARGRGYARRLYDVLFRHACDSGHELVVCEVNSHPPNPVSDAFHAALGFVEIGAGVIHGGGKTVKYLSRRCAVPAAGSPASRTPPP